MRVEWWSLVLTHVGVGMFFYGLGRDGRRRVPELPIEPGMVRVRMAGKPPIDLPPTMESIDAVHRLVQVAYPDIDDASGPEGAA